jgi:hypothetical protein
LGYIMRFSPGKLYQLDGSLFLNGNNLRLGHRFPGCLRHKYRMVRMYGFFNRGGGPQDHEEGHGRSSGQGAGIAPETQRDNAGWLIQRGLHAFPNLGRDGLLCVL